MFAGGNMNYYVLLGIRRDSDHETIRSAFRALVRRYHPDAGAGSSAEMFRNLVRAYETLSDPVRRQRYDRTLGSSGLSDVTFAEPLAVPRSMRVPWPVLSRTREWDARPPEPIRAILLDHLIDALLQSVDDWFSAPVRRRY
jgi:curved DNA-binding protein CbpA